MRHVAIDVSKEELVIFDDITGEYHSVINDTSSTAEFFQDQSYDQPKIVVGYEFTGDYHNQACLLTLELSHLIPRGKLS